MGVTIRCKCGKNEHVFKNLTLADFPEGLMDDCCLTPEQLDKGVSLVDTPPPAPMKVNLEILAFDKPLPAKKRKRRGRKPNGKR